MYVTEAMIQSMEDMQSNASEMESHIKGMMETEARMHGLELDSRHNARDMWGQLSAHMASMAPAEEAPAMEAPAEEAPAMEAPAEEAPAMEAPAELQDSATRGDIVEEAPAMDELDAVEESMEEVEHTHEDGTTHAHEGGGEEHSHEDEAPANSDTQNI